jgi:endonuclease YncB( thermonuclease family)
MDIPRFTFSGRVFFRAPLLKVYDGDTVTVALPIGPNKELARINLRLDGINACEMRGEAKEKGQIARILLIEALGVPLDPAGKYHEQFIVDQNVCIDVYCLDFEKYGRVLANIAPPGCEPVNLSLCDGEHIFRYAP